MKPDIKITKERLRTHFAYAWWQYALLVVLAFFFWNLLFQTTHYRSPEPLKVEWYCDSYVPANASKDPVELMESLKASVLSGMEETTFTQVGMDENYGEMQLSTWVAAGQGDLYLLTRQRARNMGAGGGMVDLQPYVDSGALNVGDIDLEDGYVTNEDTGKLELIGIPADTLTGLNEYGITTKGEQLCMLQMGGNNENTLKLLQYLLDTMKP